MLHFIKKNGFLAEFKRTSLEKEQNGQSWTSMRVLPPGDSGKS